MAIKEVKRYWGSCQLDYVKEFLCHTEKDVEQLPACCVGSKAYVNETGNWYACGKDQVWKLEQEATEEGGGNTGGGAYIPTGGVEFTEGYRISASSGAVSENAATDLTDFIAVNTGDKVELYGMVTPADTANVGVHFYAEDKTTKLLSMVGVDAFPHGDWTYTMQGDNVTMFVVPEWPELDGVAYMRIVASDINDKSAIVVSHNEQEGGTGLPSGGEPYMQLVTDGEGKAGWEERLAYTKKEENVQIFSGVYSGEEHDYIDLELSEEQIAQMFAAQKATVTFNGTVYELEKKLDWCFGNLSLDENGGDSGEPFLIMFWSDGAEIVVRDAGDHTVDMVADLEFNTQVSEKYLNAYVKKKYYAPDIELTPDEFSEMASVLGSGKYASVNWVYEILEITQGGEGGYGAYNVTFVKSPWVVKTYIPQENGKYNFNNYTTSLSSDFINSSRTVINQNGSNLSCSKSLGEFIKAVAQSQPVVYRRLQTDNTFVLCYNLTIYYDTNLNSAQIIVNMADGGVIRLQYDENGLSESAPS